jgi:tetratricopeptide (TPR) repeat protein
MLRLARGASPYNTEADQLSSELDRMNAALQEQLIRDGGSQIAWNSAMMPPPGAEGEAMLSAVNAFRGIADFCFDKGLWRLMPIFADRAADLALSGGGALRRVWFAAETTAAHFQSAAGHATDGLQRIDYVLAEAQKTLPIRDQIIVNARYVRASALEELGRYDEALVEINAVALLRAEVLGPRHSATLRTRYLRAWVLQNLGRYGEALAELDALAPLQVELRGARHPYTLTTRYLRAGVLQDLGRYGEALAEYETTEPIYSETLGARHDDVLVGRRYHAICLANLERWDEALREIESVYAIEQERFAETRSVQIGIEIAAECNVDHADELRKIIDALTATRGASHQSTLRARYRLTRLLFQRRRVDEARAEIVDTIGHFDQMTDPGHSLLRSAEGLLEAIEGCPTSAALTV